MNLLNASSLSVAEVENHLGFQEVEILGRYLDVLPLDKLSTAERKDVVKIAKDFRHYLKAGKVSEGLIKALTIFPLLRLAGFYSHPVELKVEEDIAQITVEDDDKVIKGRYDILAINHAAKTEGVPLWIVVAEAKNSEIACRSGLPQLLTYAYQSLSDQGSVWGLVTNGLNYQFVLMYGDKSPMYQMFPLLHLLDPTQAEQLGQILKALCALRVPTPKSAVA
ncbi:restriction endonuclease subunit R [cf. Phormidesmis sp. LEGE 11477]|uniref:restriction endonuclease subunit R n=1 Tax=cf. Phormidesmis sp. LEGE 11477 TaxID=1828680 RepID=UPI0018821AE6|nr:restriction endonuclease subunit R [cf. Phormidesmis sp. LEGE 11477]MBE9060255.1 restriction endonuclease subunit R [cf. Phormidesmis sp. LEGE 11477]